MRIYYAPLSRQIIALSGDDARSFLHGLVTVDVLQHSAIRYGALLTAQGKFLHDMFIVTDGERLLLDVPRTRVADLLSRLRLYRLRAKVDITPLEHMSVVATLPGLPGGIARDIIKCMDPRNEVMGGRCYGDAATLQHWLEDRSAVMITEAEYHSHRIQHTVPDGEYDLTPEKSLIMEYGFEALNGVDFNKGCYVGQEVTARSKFRATLRKQLFAVSASAPLPSPGTPVLMGEKPVGELLSVAGEKGLALMTTDAATGLIPLAAQGISIKPSLPFWMESAGEPERIPV